MNESHGFTKIALEKISESIRAYTYLILTSQVAARHIIIGDTAPAISAQRIFYDNLNEVISKEVSIEVDIARYQKVLKYARSKLDYSVGSHLYMLPHDMILKPLNKVIEDYNAEIVINTSDILGFQAPPPKLRVPPKNISYNGSTLAKTIKPSKQFALAEPLGDHGNYRPSTAEEHEEEKSALIFGIVSLAIFSFWFLK